ncbi:unnamed protein product [Hymenolepis diminuta]|uniref:Zf-3CxxC domain-containing protein n=1 Tax=Hymenolepis diminuta TaxID=6216 RepID=A0A0R3SRQ3_HYMDI|nr:unnamed protein product [Hymenolepis diminuta]
MRDTHWNPRFIQLSLDLAGRLLNARASCTNHTVDRWPEAQLTLLTPPDQINNTNSTSGSHLATFHLLKHILANSMPLETVFQNNHNNDVQQHFTTMRSLILTTRITTAKAPLSHHPPPAVLPASTMPNPLFNPLALQPPTMGLPLFLLSQSNRYLFPSPLPLLTASATPTLTGNLLTDILALTGPPTAAAAATPQLPGLRLPTMLPQNILSSVPTPLPTATPTLPPLIRGDQQLQPHVDGQKTNLCHVQVVCFKDEAKTRFMCLTTPIQEIKVPIGQMTDRNSHNQRLIVTLRPGANVLLELFPQACADCASHNDVRLSPPKWYPEEVDKVLRNLFVNIHRTFYKNVIFWEQQFDRRRRPGHPTGRHDNTKCLACLSGMCVNAIGQSSNQLHTPGGESADPSSQSECSPICKRRLVPSAKEEFK